MAKIDRWDGYVDIAMGALISCLALLTLMRVISNKGFAFLRNQLLLVTVYGITLIGFGVPLIVYDGPKGPDLPWPLFTLSILWNTACWFSITWLIWNFSFKIWVTSRQLDRMVHTLEQDGNVSYL